jgi:colanic acid biosynthesis glycosyl transferase WcaI
MRILLLNQTFYPDVVATAQYLTSLAEALAERGHEVRVLAARRAYDDPARRFPKRERYQGIEIERVGGTGFGKDAKWRRAVDFGSFLLRAGWRVLRMPRADRVVALTSPPLVAALAALRCRMRGERFVYWVMDMNPDEALAAGWLRPGIVAWLLERVSRFTLHSADAVVVLDRYMEKRVLAKGVAAERVWVVPPWSLDRYAYFDREGRAAFREQHGLTGKYVVMYSGNHSPVHPLDTLLETAIRLQADPRFCFVFVGGGSEFRRLRGLAEARGLVNVKFLPYQPIESLSGSLSAADLQAVVLGSAMVGTIHPSKLYNILAVGSPVLYVGPERSHVSDAMQKSGGVEESGVEESGVRESDDDAERDGGAGHYIRIGFGDVAGLAAWLEADWANWQEAGRTSINPRSRNFSQGLLLPQLVQIVEDRAETMKFGVSSIVV